MELALPALDAADWSGEAVTEVEVAGLLVDDGATVASGQAVIELSLDKTNVTVDAPTDGVIRWQVQVGDLLLPGHVVATIEP